MIICFGCSDNSTEPENEQQVIPLDGSSGGVILYRYQPLQNVIHQIYSINLDGSGNKKIINASIGLNHHDVSPDGLLISFTRDLPNQEREIFIKNIDKTNVRPITYSSSGITAINLV